MTFLPIDPYKAAIRGGVLMTAPTIDSALAIAIIALSLMTIAVSVSTIVINWRIRRQIRKRDKE